MIGLLWSILAFVIAAFGLLFIHESGHYMAGRWIVGIPAADLKLVMTESPRHVALRDGDEWVGPDEFKRYSELYERHDANYEYLELYVGAGEFVQMLGVVAIAVGLVSIGHHNAAASIVLISVLMTVFYIAFDMVFSTVRGHPTGDFSGLWLASPVATVTVLIGFFVPHVLLYVWI